MVYCLYFCIYRKSCFSFAETQLPSETSFSDGLKTKPAYGDTLMPVWFVRIVLLYVDSGLNRHD